MTYRPAHVALVGTSTFPSSTALVGAALLTFVSMSVGCSRDNEAACIEAYNQIEQVYTECNIESGFDINEECPETLNDIQGDCTERFLCFEEAYVCENGAISLRTDIDDCPPCE